MKVYAFESESNFYPIAEPASFLNVYFDGTSSATKYTGTVDGDKMVFSNPYMENVTRIDWFANYQDYEFTFPYNPYEYDYYLLGTVTAVNPTTGSNASNFDKSTFQPSYLRVFYRNYATEGNSNYPITGYNIYNIDTTTHAGFGFYVGIDFEAAENTGIHAISFINDIQGLGNKPANLTMEFGILAVGKSESNATVLSQILSQLVGMESSLNSALGSVADQITDSISDSAQQIKDSIENQYAVSDAEDFGVGQLTNQVEEKLGVLTFGADTLNNFLGLFQASNVGGTELTFPGFQIEVQGQSYNVWPDISFDLAFLEEHFGILITAVRTVTVLCVWLAVLGYLVKAKDHFINNKG